jgi:hypothetical protein
VNPFVLDGDVQSTFSTSERFLDFSTVLSRHIPSKKSPGSYSVGTMVPPRDLDGMASYPGPDLQSFAVKAFSAFSTAQLLARVSTTDNCIEKS